MNTVIAKPETTHVQFPESTRNLAAESLPVDSIRFSIGSMTCAACQIRIQRAVEQEPGVLEASVDLMLKQAEVTYHPGLITPAAVQQAITRTGYEAELISQDQSALDEQARQDQAQATEFRALCIRAIISGMLGMVAMVLSMPLMNSGPAHPQDGAADLFRHWMRGWMTPIMEAIAPGLHDLNPLALSLSLLGMTLFVMTWAGRHFYTRAWAAFRHHSADMNTLVAVGTGATFLFSVLATLAPEMFLSRGMAPELYYEAVINVRWEEYQAKPLSMYVGKTKTCT